ncbi:MAG: 3-hydroxyacyl-CoA dehydrogenase NAD-binding domain-containing protein [Alphaproteobacteria bacterium]
MVETVGIVGAGQMGSGIAHVLALHGFKVVLVDIDQGGLDRGLESISRNLERQVAKDAITTADKDAALALITTGADYGVLSGCDLVIEAVTEDEAAKCAVYEKLTPNLGPDTILATNTSSISITRLAAASGRPGKFMGMHFMNPVPVMTMFSGFRS